MALITRVSRLFRADLHAVLDRIEEPEVLLRQAVRDMEEDLAGDRQRHKLLRHEQARLVTRQDDINRSLEQIDQELDVCFQSDKHDLARALIKRQLEARRLLNFLERKRDAQQETLTALQLRIDENQARLDSMRQKSELLSEQGNAENEVEWSASECVVGDAEIEIAFLREQQKRRPS